MVADFRDVDPAELRVPASRLSGADPYKLQQQIDNQTTLLHRLDEIRRLCPDMRLGQLMATLGLLGEDATGRSLWDIEDDELAVALEKFASDLARRAGA
jgi:hypothetical protein